MDWRLFLLLWMITTPALRAAPAIPSRAVHDREISSRNTHKKQASPDLGPRSPLNRPRADPSTVISSSIPHSSSSGDSLPKISSKGSSSSSVLAALMESQYTELMELMGHAGMLEPLEKVVGKGSITIFAPRNAYMEQQVDSEFKHFLLEPGNIKHLRQVLKHHIVPGKIMSEDWSNRTVRTLSTETVRIHSHRGINRVELSEVTSPNDINKKDGVVHGVNGLLVPRSVQEAFSVKKLGSSANALLPQASPEFDPLGASLAEMSKEFQDFLEAAESPLPLEFAYAPEVAPAPAPGPSSGKHRVYTWEDVDDFVSTLANFGGYSEMAELLVNLTSFAWDMAKLVNEGHRLTLLAPNDHAMDHLTTEQLNAPGGLEAILMYHVLTEYQTEESLYNAVRRFEKVKFLTLWQPHTIHAKETDGTVQFGEGESGALLYDHDIFTDGHISIQGISKVLTIPPAETKDPKEVVRGAGSPKSKRGRGLFETRSKQSGFGITQSIRQLLHF
ncbi:fasciclin-like arabinogalactan protein 17 [Selaginella moellendorffii]|nr:fasciclin-like arabinogalactan protein 17 [Selaginella moellendorffii]|eukprot:XP_002990854.2 fasciclin-like arabinogalactan protein 17 [Selaginella moellendorffii]